MITETQTNYKGNSVMCYKVRQNMYIWTDLRGCHLNSRNRNVQEVVKKITLKSNEEGPKDIQGFNKLPE